MRIYFDHNAGAPLRPEAREAIERLMRDGAGNPASVHRAGQRARRALEIAREQVAASICADPRELVFTSGGTESNNAAIAGALGARRSRRKIVTSAIEHSSILAAVEQRERDGFEVARIAPDRDGRVAAADLIGAIDRDTALVTLGVVNGEVGAIQAVDGIAARARDAGALFHVDAAQALGRIALDVRALGCDLMTLSGHKVGAPGGIGALYVRDGAGFAPLLVGGAQESARRAGTPNLLGAAAFGAAAEAASRDLAAEAHRVGALAERLLRVLAGEIPGVALNGPLTDRVSNTLNLTFPGVHGETMLIALDLEGLEVSMGSACAAGSVEPSHVLIAMGRTRAEARSSLRLSLGWSTSEAEVDAAAEIIVRVWRRVVAREPAAHAVREAAG